MLVGFVRARGLDLGGIVCDNQHVMVLALNGETSKDDFQGQIGISTILYRGKTELQVEKAAETNQVSTIRRLAAKK